MARKRYTTEQIIGMLRETKVRLSQGETIAAKLRDVGFEDVRVSGQGSTRHSEARWSGSDTRALLPSQITSVSEVDDT